MAIYWFYLAIGKSCVVQDFSVNVQILILPHKISVQHLAQRKSFQAGYISKINGCSTGGLAGVLFSSKYLLNNSII